MGKNSNFLNTLNVNRFNLALALFIIVWGAWVRLSGSGAGCGEHWPLCNGEVIPLSAGYKTLIEFTHRITSGIYGLTVLFCVWFAKKDFGPKSPVFKWSIAVLIFTIIEALIGAVLVKKGLVDKDTSEIRAFVIALHLANTYLLLSTHAAVEYYSINHEKRRGTHNPGFYALFVLFLIVGASGAVTALGNTLFPDTSLIEGMAKDFSQDSPFLIRLRIYHPIAAILLSLGLIWWSRSLKISSRYLGVLTTMVMIAIGFGVVNWLLMSPSWAALVHLILGDILLLSFVLVGFDAYYKREPLKPKH